jgi:hypothetical protein
MPPSHRGAHPPTDASRPTLRKYYQSTQDAALTTFLSSRNGNTQHSSQPLDPQHNASTSSQYIVPAAPTKRGNAAHQDLFQEGSSRVVRRRMEQDSHVAMEGGGLVSNCNLVISWFVLLTQLQNIVAPHSNGVMPGAQNNENMILDDDNVLQPEINGKEFSIASRL